MIKIVAAFVLLTATVHAQLNFPQDTVAYNERFNNRQTVALDAEGRLHISYTGQLGTNSATREIYYATESADSFVTMKVTNNSVDDNYSTLSLDRSGFVHVGFLGRDAGNLFQVQYSRLLNGSFTAPRFITQGGLNKATPYSAIGKDSVVHFVYFTFTDGSDSVYYRKLNLRDSSISPQRTLTVGETSGDFDMGVATDTSGFVHIAVKSGSVFGGPMKYYSDKSGQLVEMPTGVSGNVEYPKVVIDKRNVVHIVYRDATSRLLYIINNQSGSFGAPLPLTPAGQRPSGFQNLGVDDNNRIYVVYQSSQSASGRGFYLVHGKDGVFSDTIKVYDLTPEYVTRNSSAMVARGNGEVAVLYAPGGIRNSLVICDIFLKRGSLFPTAATEETSTPQHVVLHQNYPNPFNPTTEIRYHLPAWQARTSEVSRVTLKVYDVLGREIATLVDELKAAGTYTVEWNARGVASGVYLYRLATAGGSAIRKLVVVR